VASRKNFDFQVTVGAPEGLPDQKDHPIRPLRGRDCDVKRGGKKGQTRREGKGGEQELLRRRMR